MILVDTSAWIEFLRNTGSSACVLVDEVLAEEVAICDPVRMEVLAGARDETHLSNLRSLLARTMQIETMASDYDDAAALYRRCRRQGETIRRLTDCLIAAVAIRTSAPILHSDDDFERLARHTALSIFGPKR